MNWKRKKIDGIVIRTSKNEYGDFFEIRSWPYDESGEGRFQLCKNDFHKGKFKTLKDAKSFVENFDF